MMWWLYLDESGDLGFDFVNKKPSKFFTIAILATSSEETNRTFKWSVKRTLRNKLNPVAKRTRHAQELKGCGTLPGGEGVRLEADCRHAFRHLRADTK